MAVGKHSICRGHELGETPVVAPRFAGETAEGAIAPAHPLPPLPASLSADYGWIHERLTAVERLVRLYDQGALSEAEFAAEKAVILGGERPLPSEYAAPLPGLPTSFSPARVQASRRVRGPSLFGRLLCWPVLLPGLAAGVALSLASQPEATMHFLDEGLRLFGF
ncbi:MAG: SHOCT domain-containing protein [Sphingosinicella sp.]